MREKQRRLKRAISLFMLSFVIAVSSVFMVFAAEDPEVGALAELSSGVKGTLDNETYKLEGGGTINGKDLFVENDAYSGNGGSKVYTVGPNFSKLSNASQTQFVDDIANASYDVADGSKNVDDSTIEVWWKQLQSREGVGSKFMMTILKDTKPDFVSARSIFTPFSGPISTLLGLGCIVIVSLLGLVIVCDISYIVIPPVRIFYDDSTSGNHGRTAKSITSHLFSAAAIMSVKQCENESRDGGLKQPLGMYFKAQALQMIVLGICLMYLVAGQLYTLVGWILDLMRGFLKF